MSKKIKKDENYLERIPARKARRIKKGYKIIKIQRL
jgi:hypothetical protein